MKDVSVGSRYAKALFLVTERRGETVAALADLKGVRDLLAHGGRVASFLGSPQVRMPDKRKLLSTGLEGRAARSVLAFADLLLRKKRLDLLPDITDQFEALVENAQGIRRAHLVSAVPLPAPERERLLATLERTTASKIRLTTEVDAALLGGALVRIGDRVIDRSVRTLLDSIAAQLYEASV
ncbi:MAG TPA: ATP synthase F1 subunit delta [Candidatus Eisenbacteria bacterium]|nr:ATP synthase F1 subunit delta [Candidatus Eisenbacteria bacterium]